ncbi:MAG: Tn3 family transposase [Pseudomonadales bacterium]
MKKDPGAIGLESVLKQIKKLDAIRSVDLPTLTLENLGSKLLDGFKRRVCHETAWELRQHPPNVRYGLLVMYLYCRQGEIVDDLIELFLQLVSRLDRRAEQRATKSHGRDQRAIQDKTVLLYKVAEAVHLYPDARVKDVITPLFGEDALSKLLSEGRAAKQSYDELVHGYTRSSYAAHYRRMLPSLLEALEFRSNNTRHRPVLDAVDLLSQYIGARGQCFHMLHHIPIKDVIRPKWRNLISRSDADGTQQINRIDYEVCVLRVLRERLRCKEIWVVGANKYRNPDLDLPTDFEEKRTFYYEDLGHPTEVQSFVLNLKRTMQQALHGLNRSLPHNARASIYSSGKNRIALSPLKPQGEPIALHYLKKEITKHWPGTPLIDVFKEADMRIGFTDFFRSTASREILDRHVLQHRLLLCLYAMGTNTGMKRVINGDESTSYKELLHIRRRYITKAAFQNAVSSVANAIMAIRKTEIWGEGTTACASDSKQFGAWDQNLMTEWHQRYGGRGVMIYWHVEKQSTCIHSQLKRVSSSEVASMIEGVLRHCTDMSIERQYVDSHGQSEIGFAFSYLLGFDLLPRLKAIGRQKLYQVGGDCTETYANLEPVLARPIRWDLISQQYDEMIKFATALKQGTADSESILRRFTRNNARHPTYQALSELGKAVKTLFLCRYIDSEELRREIHGGFNVVENWNSANSFIFFGKGGEVATNNLDEQELSVWALHLLQISLVYVNTLMIQQVFTYSKWATKMREEDYRALTPLIYSHINPYGAFNLDLSSRISIEGAA